MPVDPTHSPEPIDPTESTVSSLFRAGPSPSLSSVDPQEVIRRSRRRRLPRRIGMGSALSLAVVGIGIAGITSAGGFAPGVSTSADSSSLAESATTAESTEPFSDDASEADTSAPGLIEGGVPDAGISRAPAEKINLCGGALAEVAPAESGLQLTVDFPDATAGSTSVTGTAILTNTGSTSITGYSGATPAITLSRDGIVVWHSNGPTILSLVDITLAPGESLTYAASFTPVVCEVEDDLGESFRDSLPAASPGEYQVSAALDVSGDVGSELVTGPASTITLR
jgi:hypothetical protein